MVYPRTCGGTRFATLDQDHGGGLSPHVRGNPDVGMEPHVQPGSIPARAGEPDGSSAAALYCWVYPRTCGGTPATFFFWNFGHGLSPHVRGNLLPSAAAARSRGSIPARAGEPELVSRRHCLCEVYPRTCGGTLARVRFGHSLHGLSPHVRGNPPAEGRSRPAEGSIPARAGEPLPDRSWDVSDRVYPRTCGGTVCAHCLSAGPQGLSPHVRGNPSRHHDVTCAGRSIPARAGEPSYHERLRPRNEVYPRTCGGTRESHQ